MDKKVLRRNADVFSALGDETRLYLIKKLGNAGKLSITELTDGLSISRQAVSKHLRVLEEADLVKCERTGRETHFELHGKPLVDAISLLESVERKWDQRLMRLKLFTENSD